MAPRLVAMVCWLLVAVSLVFWGMRLLQSPAAMAAGGPAAPEPLAVANLGRLLGQPAPLPGSVVAEPALASRFRLVGVIAARAGSAAAASSQAGVALLAVDAKPPRPYRVGARIDGEFVLRKVGVRSAEIGRLQGPSVLLLELPPLPVLAGATAPASPRAAPATPNALPQNAVGNSTVPSQPGDPEYVEGQRFGELPPQPHRPSASESDAMQTGQQ